MFAATSVTIVALIIYDLSTEHSKVRNLYRSIYHAYKPNENFEKPFKKNRGGTLTHIIIYSQLADRKITKQDNPDQTLKNLHKSSIYDISNEKPDIILVLHESIFNVNKILNIKDIPNYAMLDQTNLDCLGNLNVNVYGGETHISEFNTLTGIDLKSFSGIYQTNPPLLLDHHDAPLPKILAENGYSNYLIEISKGNTYTGKEFHLRYGWDNVYDKTYFENLVAWKLGGSDLFLFQKAVEILQEPSNTPKFLFIQTMQNHGPYHLNESTKNIVKTENSGLQDCLNEYLTRLETIDRDFKTITDYVNNAKKKTILIYFGDHHPGFTHSLSLSKDYGYNQTFYAIKANFPIDKKQCLPNLDIVYLPGLMLDLIKQNNNELFQLNSLLRQKENGKFDLSQKLCSSYSGYINNKIAENCDSKS